MIRVSVRSLLQAALTLLAGLCAAELQAASSKPTDEQFVVDSWGSEQGLGATIRDVVQGPQGFLWLASEDGFIRFDGREFKAFNSLNVPALTTDLVDRLLVDPEGRLLIGAQTGLLMRFQERTEMIFPDVRVRALHHDGTALWIGTERGLVRREGEKTREYFAGTDILCLAAGPDDRLYVGTRSGFFSLDDEDSEPVQLSEQIIEALLVDSEERLWAGMNHWNIARRELVPAGPDVPVVALLEDRDGRIWAGGPQGLLIFDGATPRFFDADRLPDTDVTSLSEDHEGSIWVGTMLGGLAQIRRSAATFIGETEGLRNSNVWTTLEDDRGRIWIGGTGGLSALEPEGGLRNIVVNPKLPKTSIAALGLRKTDVGEEIWVGTYGQGLFRLREDGERFEPTAGGESFVVRRIVQAPSGVLHVGTNHGIYLFEELPDGSMRGRKDPLVENSRVQDMLWETSGASMPGATQRWWFAFSDGLLYGEGDGEVVLTSARVAGLERIDVRSIYGGEEALWLATDRGLARLAKQGGVFGHLGWIRQSEGLPRELLHTVLVDGEDRLWMSSNHGLFTAPRAALTTVAGGNRVAVDWQVWDQSHGLRTSEANGGAHPAGLRTRDGRMIFATIEGLAIFEPGGRLRRNDAPPPVAFREILIDGRVASSTSPAVLEYGDREIVISYSGAGYTSPEQVLYRYRLVPRGGEQETLWNTSSTRREAVFNELPPGEYVFEATARNNDGVWSREAARLEIVVRPAWFQTKLFFLSCAAMLALLIFGAHRLRLRRLLRRQKELLQIQNELAQRNAELEEIAYAAEHDLRNPLVTIQSFLGVLESDLAAGRSDRLSFDVERIRTAANTLDRLLQDLFEPARRSRPLTNPEGLDTDELVEEALVAVGPRIEQSGIEISIESSMPAVRGERQRLVLMLQSLLENAVVHMGDVEAPRVEVSARRRGDQVMLNVADNGRGIEPRYQEKIFDLFEQLNPSNSAGSGVGLSLARRIARIHGGDLQVESEGEGRGATFVVTLPAAVQAPKSAHKRR